MIPGCYWKMGSISLTYVSKIFYQLIEVVQSWRPVKLWHFLQTLTKTRIILDYARYVTSQRLTWIGPKPSPVSLCWFFKSSAIKSGGHLYCLWENPARWFGRWWTRLLIFKWPLPSEDTIISSHLMLMTRKITFSLNRHICHNIIMQELIPVIDYSRSPHKICLCSDSN